MSEFMHDYPTRRIDPRDGMAINAHVWQEAHDYHRLRDQHHTRLAGHGILHGLKVVQTKLASSAVWILPGFAVDSDGRTIVLKVPHKCDVGSTRGTVYIYLTVSEHKTTGDGRTLPEGEDQALPSYVQEDVNIFASALLPRAGDAFVELTRIQRSDLVAVKDAIHPRRPGNTEIDLRYRREVLPRVLPTVNAGVLQLGAMNSSAWEGLDALAQSAAFAQQCRLLIEDEVDVRDLSTAHDVLFVRAQAPFTPEPALVAALRAWLDVRKVLFVDVAGDAANAGALQASLDAMFSALGVTLAPLPPAHPLLTCPHRFALWPDGGPQGSIRVATLPACHLIVSDMDMSALWCGTAHGKPAAREAIRAAHEWGMNVLAYVLHAQHADAAASEDSHA